MKDSLLLNERVRHLKKDGFGEGVIIEHDVDTQMFWVLFPTDTGDKTLKFRYPAAFEDLFIEPVNPDLIERLNLYSSTEKITRKKELLRINELHRLRDDLHRDERTKELLSMLKSQWKRRGLAPGFYHYTDFDNFISIMTNETLLSRAKLAESNTDFYDSASAVAIDRTDDFVLTYVRLFYAPKTPFSYVTEGIKCGDDYQHMANPVAFLFDKEIVYEDKVIYSDVSGSHVSDSAIIKGHQTENPDEALRFNWDYIFHRGSLYGLADSGTIITQRNAELWYPEHISTLFINKIYFRTPACKKMAEYVLGKDERFIVDSNYQIFSSDISRRRSGEQGKINYTVNWLEDYSIDVNNELIDINLSFKTYDVKSYTHTLEILSDGHSLIETIPISSNNSNVHYQHSVSDSLSINRINYYMDGHLSAVWIKGKEI